MSRTFIRQETQIRKSDVYDDTLAAGSTLESTPVHIQDDLNGLRSQVKRAIGDTDWFSDIATVNGKKRAIKDLNTDLDDLEAQKVLARVAVLTDISVTAAQNFEVLSVAGSEAPTQVAAVALTQDGAVVAQSALNGAGFEVHELIEIAGSNAIDPKNLVLVRDATTGQPVQSSGRDVFGLLQYESTGVDGVAFNDTSGGGRVKISFVRLTTGLDDLEACPVADIAGKTVNYSYVRRLQFDDLPEEYWLNGSTFTDHTTQVDVTRQRAYDNQGATPVELTTDADLDLALTKAWAIRDANDADLLQVTEGSGAGVTTVAVGADVDTLDVDAAVNDFSRGLRVDTAGQRINVGETAGLIESTSTNDLRLLGAGELLLDDGNQTGSTWAQTSGIKLSEDSAEWDAFETTFGEVSLLKAIVEAKNASAESKTFAVVTAATIAADTDVSLADGNIDAALPAMDGGSFDNNYDVYLNGTLLRPGADASANHDYYPGTSLATAAQLKFEFQLRLNDVICVVKKIA